MASRREATYWYDEIRAAEAHNCAFTRQFNELTERYAGPYYRGSTAQAEGAGYDPENFAHTFVSLMLPLASAAPPKMIVRSSLGGRVGVMARGAQFTVNRWVRQTRLIKRQEAWFVDYAHGLCVSHAGTGIKPGVRPSDQPIHTPVLRRIHPTDFGWDPAAASFEDAHFLFHKDTARVSDLMALADEDESWNKENIEASVRDAGQSAKRQALSLPDRDELVIYWLWIKDFEFEDAELDAKRKPYQSGAIACLAYETDAEDAEDATEGGYDEEGMPIDTVESRKSLWLLPPQPYYGPREGPYTIGGAYPVPNEPVPLGPIPAVQAQADDLNEHTRAMLESMRRYKRMVLVSDEDPNLATILKDGRHDGVYPVNIDEIRNKVVNLEVGGTTEQHQFASADKQQRLDRNSGVNDIQRGNVGVANFATEVAAAQQSATLRAGHHPVKFQRFMEESLGKVLFLMWMDERVKMDMGPEARNVFARTDEQRLIETPVWEGGPLKGQTVESLLQEFESLDWHIEASSMSQPSDERRVLVMQVVQETLMEVAALTETYPWLRVEEYVNWKSDQVGVPELPSFFDFKKGREMGALKMQLQTVVQPDQAPQEPRMGNDKAGQPGAGGIHAMGRAPSGGAGQKQAQPSSPSGGGGQGPILGSAKPGGRDAKKARTA